MTETHPMETAPRDGTEILVFARWDWDGLHKGEGMSWRVAAWDDGVTSQYKAGFWATSSNPYSDLAVDPQTWASLPAPKDTP